MFIMGERISFVPFQGNWDVIQSNFAMLWVYIWKFKRANLFYGNNINKLALLKGTITHVSNINS